MVNAKYYSDFIKAWGEYILNSGIRTTNDFYVNTKYREGVDELLKDELRKDTLEFFKMSVDYECMSNDAFFLVDFELLQTALDCFWIGIKNKK
jgi:hypothetical protein